MLRDATPADRDEVIALALAEDAAWARDAPPVSDEEAGELVDQFPPGVAYEVRGRVVGCAAVAEGGDALLLMDPQDGGPALEALVAWLVSRDAAEVPAYAADARRIALLEARGHACVGAAYDLERGIEPPPAAPAWPAGLEVEAYTAGTDDAAVWHLVYVDSAWSEVPGHTERPLAGWTAALTPEHRSWVARRGDGTLVGWVSGRVFPDGRGWIQQLAVSRGVRGEGLGRALLLQALAGLREDGATTYALGVQGANERAVALYRGVGFTVSREWRRYALQIAP